MAIWKYTEVAPDLSDFITGPELDAGLLGAIQAAFLRVAQALGLGELTAIPTGGSVTLESLNTAFVLAQSRVTGLAASLTGAANSAIANITNALGLGTLTAIPSNGSVTNASLGSGFVVAQTQVAELVDDLLEIFGLANTAVDTTVITNGTLAQLLAKLNAQDSGGNSYSKSFVGTNGTAISAYGFTQYVPSPFSITIQSNKLGTGTNSTSDGVYTLAAVYTERQFANDDQSVSVVLGTNNYANYGVTYLFLRSNVDATAVCYCSIDIDGIVAIGKATRSGTTWATTEWESISTRATFTSFLEFRVTGNDYEVLLDNSIILQNTNTTANTGALYRYAGVAFTARRAFFTNYTSWWIAQFNISDYIGSNFPGVGFAFSRANLAAATAITGSSTGNPFAGNTFDVTEHSTVVPIINEAAGIARIPESGWWEFEVAASSNTALTGSAQWVPALYSSLTNPPTTITHRGNSTRGTGDSEQQRVGSHITAFMREGTYVRAGFIRQVGTGDFTPRGMTQNNGTTFRGRLK